MAETKSKIILFCKIEDKELIPKLVQADERYEIISTIVSDEYDKPELQHLDKYIDNLFREKKFKY
jgi:hypothetical protein